jgi:hypothetical protein
MKSPLLTTAAAFAAGSLALATLHAGGMLAADYDAGQTAGASLTGATAVIPTTNSATTSVTVVSGAANPAGGGAGSGFRIVDKGGSAAGVEYHFASGTAAQFSSFRVDFDFARVAAGPAASLLVFGCGEFHSSTSLRLNTNAQRFLTVEFTGDGKANFISATGADSSGHALAAGKNHLTVFVNDKDTSSVSYARPDTGASQTLAANSVAFWLNAGHVLTTTLDTLDATAAGTVGTSETNFGRLGFVTFSTSTGMDWNFDNVSVTELSPVGIGTTYFVTDAAGFNALPSLSAGDVVILRNGAYGSLNKTLVSGIADDDTAEANPVVVKAETPGGVDVTAPSKIVLQGRGIVLAGLDFLPGSGLIDNGTTSPTWMINTKTASRCMRISNIRFLNCVSGDDYGHWIFVNGFKNTIEYCSFEGKDEPNANATIAFKGYLSEGAATVPRQHVLRNCYFGPRLCSATDNGYETLRIGDSDSQAIDMRVTVERSLFYRAIWRNDASDPNDIEIISSKSKGNRIRNNTFLESRGQITLRHGDACTVDGNFIIGGGYYSGNSLLMNSTADGYQAGIRIIGQDHIVRNNYLINLQGVNLRAALCLMSGTAVWNDGNGENGHSGYEPAHNAKIYNNTFVDCYQMNLGYVKSGSTAPTGVQIHNNAWQGNSTGYGIKKATDFTPAAADGNYVFQPTNSGWKSLGGIYTTTVSPDITEAVDNYLRPTATSLLLNAASPTLAAANDVRNVTRPASGKDIGCYEREVSGTGRRPLRRRDVGPIFDGGPAGTYP